MPAWAGTATLLAFVGYYILLAAFIVDMGLERWKGKHFLPYRARGALLVVVYVTLPLWLGGWSLYTIITRDAYWEPLAIIVLWLATVMLIFLPAYVFFWTRHLEQQHRAQSRNPDT